MKLQCHEHEDVFAIELEAENQQDAALLTRMGLMAAAEQRRPYVAAYRDGQFLATVRIKKVKHADGAVRPWRCR
jgi:hypothetical protein